MAIPDWPADERPREKLLRKGPGALSDAELIAIFLRNGIIGHTAVDMSRALLTRFGSLRAILNADLARFCAVPGCGPVAYAQLQGALELYRRYLEAGMRRGDAITRPEDTRRLLQGKLGGYQREVFVCLFLDNRHRLIDLEELFYGTIDAATVHPREIVKRALHHNAAAAILAHNHPSGVAEPSRADTALTTRIRDALALVDVRLLDHFVIGDGEVVSLAERGLM